MENLFDLNGMNAVITGGGKGIGKAIAQGFLTAGANVVIIGSGTAVEETDAQFQVEFGKERIFAIRADLSDSNQREEAFKQCCSYMNSKIDILVNNAGIQKRVPIEQFDMKDWNQILEVNLTAVFDFSRKCAELMKKQHYGKIISISSIGAFVCSGKNIPAYLAAKGGVKQLTRCFASEWGKYGICTNDIAPGYIETELTKSVCESVEIYEQRRAKIPIGRWGKPEDIKGAAILLASHAGDYINGTTIIVDGGLLSE